MAKATPSVPHSSSPVRMAILLLPLALFLGLSVYLFKGLFSDPTQLESVLVDKPVPAFQLADLYHPEQQLGSEVLSGQPMLLNVWATWCPTCFAEHQYLNRLAAEGVHIVGLNYKDDRQEAIAWLERLGNPYRISLYDPTGMLGLELGVYGAPETYLIDSQGIIRYRHVGDVNERIWQQQLQSRYEAMQ